MEDLKRLLLIKIESVEKLIEYYKNINSDKYSAYKFELQDLQEIYSNICIIFD